MSVSINRLTYSGVRGCNEFLNCINGTWISLKNGYFDTLNCVLDRLASLFDGLMLLVLVVVGGAWLSLLLIMMMLMLVNLFDSLFDTLLNPRSANRFTSYFGIESVKVIGTIVNDAAETTSESLVSKFKESDYKDSPISINQ